MVVVGALEVQTSQCKPGESHVDASALRFFGGQGVGVHGHGGVAERYVYVAGRIVYLVEIACVAAVACHASEGFQLVAQTVGRHGVEAGRFAAPYAGVETHRVGRRAALLHSAEGFGSSRLVASGEHHLSQQIGEPRLLSAFGCGGGLAQRGGGALPVAAGYGGLGLCEGILVAQFVRCEVALPDASEGSLGLAGPSFGKIAACLPYTCFGHSLGQP